MLRLWTCQPPLANARVRGAPGSWRRLWSGASARAPSRSLERSSDRRKCSGRATRRRLCPCPFLLHSGPALRHRNLAPGPVTQGPFQRRPGHIAWGVPACGTRAERKPASASHSHQGRKCPMLPELQQRVPPGIAIPKMPVERTFCNTKLACHSLHPQGLVAGPRHSQKPCQDPIFAPKLPHHPHPSSPAFSAGPKSPVQPRDQGSARAWSRSLKKR